MIVQTPNPVLTQKTKPVGKIDKKINQIIDRMKKTLISTRNPRGVGLAAPQIGKNLAIFITRPRNDSPIRVFINPRIISHSNDLAEINREEKSTEAKDEKKLEGCLSIDNIWGHLKRPSQVKLEYMDLDGQIRRENFTGFMATIVQHETDHLSGILFTQRVLEQKEKLYKIEEDKDGKEKLVEIEI